MTTETIHTEATAATNSNEQAEGRDVKLENGKEQGQNASQQSQKPQKSRHRASVACASCRDRRIRV